MKFIKTRDGYVDAKTISAFFIAKVNETQNGKAKDTGKRLINFHFRDGNGTVAEFDTEDEAKKYLEELVNNLNQEAKIDDA